MASLNAEVKLAGGKLEYVRRRCPCGTFPENTFL